MKQGVVAEKNKWREAWLNKDGWQQSYASLADLFLGKENLNEERK